MAIVRNFTIVKRFRTWLRYDMSCLADYSFLKSILYELCEYFGFDDLFPYDDLDEIEKRFKDFLDEATHARIKLMSARNKKD